MQSEENSFRWRLFWWMVFAAAFGVTEAALVVYVRQLLGYPVGLDYAEIWAKRAQTLSVFAMGDELKARHLFGVELAREAGTIVLLVGAAMAAGRSARERFGVFCYTFALWDLTYYAYLIAFIGFPRSLTAIDVYFLIPITWYGPVWFPVCVVMPALLAAGVWLMRSPKTTATPSADPARSD
ncbi:MAG: hypothetical protein H7Y38_03200 [Armatimonadetes bacterium]|nr:hypothetical protein [Armatimonadota bacterium]